MNESLSATSAQTERAIDKVGAGEDNETQRPVIALSLAALGVVYGDIGTSPLYALKECFNAAHGVAPTPENVLGVLSLIVWSLILVVSVKYLLFVLKADNKGEGGIIALVALLNPWRVAPGSLRHVLMLMGLFGAALLYGDATITPAISVLSAVEGLKVAAPVFDDYVVPIAIAILLLLFAFQKHGTSKIGALFGPVMLIWFAVLGSLGLLGLIARPQVLGALLPHYAIGFLLNNGLIGFIVLGTVFLSVTGAEALYADMGHFGRQPIRLAWFVVALPALLLNYFGQGALILSDRALSAHPFYGLSPQWAHYPLILLATSATVIASQAVISGTFSHPASPVPNSAASSTGGSRSSRTVRRIPCRWHSPPTRPLMTSSKNETPQLLTHTLEHNKVLHERVVLVTISIEDEPYVASADRVNFEYLPLGFNRVVLHYGFMQSPNVPVGLRFCERFGLDIDIDTTTFFLGHEEVIPSRDASALHVLRTQLFAFLWRNATRATAFYNIPTQRVVAIGLQVEM